MADPLSIAGLLIAVGQVISNLYSYGTSVKEARQDITNLSIELFALKGILEHISKQYKPDILQPQSTSSLILAEEYRAFVPEVLKATSGCLEFLLRRLEQPRSALRQALQTLKWPLDKNEVSKHVSRLERLKATLVLIFVTGNSAGEERIHAAIATLRTQLETNALARDAQQDNMILLSWLAPVSTEKDHARVCQTRHPGTGQWFIEGHFRPWVSDPEQTLLCLRGKSGSGKSTLFSLAVQTIEQHCRTEPSSDFAYFYCSFKEALTQQPANVLGSVTSQFTNKNPSLLDQFRAIYDSSQSLSHKPSIRLEELERLLCQHFDTLDSAYILIDAIDESQHKVELSESLLRMMGQSKSLRVLVSTTSLFEQSQSLLTKTIDLQPEINQQDICTLVDYSIKSNHSLARLEDELKLDIREALLNGADGSFRWIHLSLENLGGQRTGRAVRQALKTLPETLNAVYCSIISQIPPADRAMARKALSWLSYSLRPLTLAELNEAVVIEDGQTTIANESRLHQRSAILEMCRGLVEYNAGYVSLAHSSVKKFLTFPMAAPSDFRLDLRDRTLMYKCLQYLSLECFQSGLCSTREDLATRFEEYPLLEYAAQCWAVHAKTCRFQPEDLKTILQFLDTKELPDGGNFGAWVQALLPNAELSKVRQAQPLYYAASYGLEPVVAALLTANGSNSMDIDARGGNVGSTPLFAACCRGHIDVASLLIHAGADLKLVDPSGFTVESLLESIPKTIFDGQQFLDRIRMSPPRPPVQTQFLWVNIPGDGFSTEQRSSLVNVRKHVMENFLSSRESEESTKRRHISH